MYLTQVITVTSKFIITVLSARHRLSQMAQVKKESFIHLAQAVTVTGKHYQILVHPAQGVRDGTGKKSNSLIHLAQALTVTGKNITKVLYTRYRLSQWHR